MFRCFVVFCLFVSLCARANEISLIGDALAVENPCGNYVITVERLIGGPPNKEEYWDGTVNLQNYRNLSEAVVTVYLTSPGYVTVNDKSGKLSSDANPFNITFFKSKDDVYNAKFHVRALPDHELPRLSGLQLNGEDICPNLNEVTAVVLEQLASEINNKVGPSSEAEIGVESSSSVNYDSSDRENKDITWPWLVSIYQNITGNLRLKCAGIHIGPKSVLTTGHCVSSVDGPLDVTQFKIEFLKLGIQANVVKSMMVHHNFSYSDHENDVALLEIDSIDTLISTAPLWKKSDETGNTLDESEIYLTTKSYESTDIVQNRIWPTPLEDCLHNPLENINTLLCGKLDNNLEICSEQEGSGVFLKKDNQYYLHSLLSTTNMETANHKCMNTNVTTYINLDNSLEWIQQNIV